MEILKQSIIDAPRITGSRATQKEPDYPSCWPTIRELVAQSEFVSQRELHHARLGQQAGVGSETVRRLGKRSEQRRSYTLGVEAGEVRHIKNFPPKLHGVTLGIRHLPALHQAHV